MITLALMLGARISRAWWLAYKPLWPYGPFIRGIARVVPPMVLAFIPVLRHGLGPAGTLLCTMLTFPFLLWGILASLRWYGIKNRWHPWEIA